MSRDQSITEPHEVLNALRDLIAAAEEAGWDVGENIEVLNRGREAYAVTCGIFGDAPCEGNDRHHPVDATVL